MYLPHFVVASSSPRATTAASIVQIEVLTPRNSVCAKSWNAVLSKNTSRFPPATIDEQPLMMKAIASVAISELIRRTVTTIPLSSPTSRPAPIPATIAKPALWWGAKFPAMTAANP